MGDPNQISEEELPEMTADTLISSIETWRPERMKVEGGTTGRGLELALSRYAAEHPEAAGDIANKLIKPNAAPSHVNAILGGFMDALEKDQAVPWRQALELAAFAITRANEAEHEIEDSNSRPPWHWAAGSAARLIQKGCARDLIPEEEADYVWKALGKSLIRSYLGFQRRLVRAQRL